MKRSSINLPLLSSTSSLFLISFSDTLTNTFAKGMNINVQVTLKKVWNNAICKAGSSIKH